MISSGNIKVGMSKPALRSALSATTLSEDPFLVGCYKAYDRQKRIEVLAPASQSYFLYLKM